MFNKLALVSNVFAALCFVTPAQAAFVPTDWKADGDTKASLDTDSGLEWLDVSLTDSMSISQVQSLLTSTYAGWRLPTYDEVQQMFRNVFGVTQDRNWNLLVDGNDYATFLNNFGFTHSNYVSYGTYLSADGMTVYAGGAGGDAYGKIYTNYTYGNTIDSGVIYAGVFLVSDGGTTLSSMSNPTLNINNPNAPVNTRPSDVSALGSAGAASALLLGLAGFRRRKKTINHNNDKHPINRAFSLIA